MFRRRLVAALAGAFFLVGAAGARAAGPAYLVKDITSAPAPLETPYPDIRAVWAGRLVFVSYGRLWSSDGTAAGTAVVPGAPRPERFVGTFDGFAYMVASDDAHGRELWRTDGTVEGTRLVCDLTPGFDGSAITDLVRFRGALYFGAGPESSYYGRDNALWRTDGTPAGTVRVASIGPSVSLAALGDRLLFVNGPYGGDYPTNYALYAYDGAAPTLVREFTRHSTDGVCPGPCPTTGPNGFVIMDGIAYFRANDGVTGLELWRTDGTPGGTRLVRDICSPGPCYGLRDSEALRVVGHSLFFFASDLLHGHELWTSDGTAEGTRLVRDLNAGSWDGIFYFRNSPALESAGGAVVFGGYDPDVVPGAQLWRSDGSVTGTVPITLFPGGLYPDRIERAGDDVYFRTYGSYGSAAQLWKVAPGGGSVLLVANLESDAFGLTSADGSLFFAALWHGDAWLWKSDGSAPPAPLAVLRTAASGSSTSLKLLGESHGRLLFRARSGYSPSALWSSDGTETGTRAISDVPVGGPYDDSPVIGTRFAGNLYFPSTDSTHPPQVWRTDGTPEGTLPVSTLDRPLASTPCGLSVAAGSLFFGESGGAALWRSDGSTAEVVLPVAAACGAGGVVFPWRGFGFFVGGFDSADRGLWRTDGTAAGTIRLSTQIAWPAAVFGSRLFLYGGGVLTSDGEPGDPTPLEIPAGVYAIVAAESGVFVLTGDSRSASELWKTDGTPAGTVRLGVWHSVYRADDLVASGGRAFFVATDPDHGRELWTSDGTPEGTRMVLDVAPGPADSSPANLTVIDGVLLFSARDGRHGQELWRSDGTAAGTFLLQDIQAGSGSSSPADFTRAGSLVYFTADDGVHGRELWAIPAAALSPRPGERFRDPRVVPSRP